MLSLKIDIDIKVPKVKAADLINEIADEVKKDHSRRIDKGEDINGTLKSLKASTIAKKQSDGMLKPSTPLYATGKMSKLKDYKRATDKDLTAIVGVRESRQDIATYHQEGTSGYKITPKNATHLSFVTENGVQIRKSVNHPGVPKREWFGLTKEMESKADKMTEKFIEKFTNGI